MTDIDIDTETLHQGLAWGAIGFGAAATLAPRFFEGLYGLTDNAELRVMVRLWGTNSLVLGASQLIPEKDQRKNMALVLAAMNAADALIIAGAGSEVKKRSRVLGSLTSAAFAAGYAACLSGS